MITGCGVVSYMEQSSFKGRQCFHPKKSFVMMKYWHYGDGEELNSWFSHSLSSFTSFPFHLPLSPPILLFPFFCFFSFLFILSLYLSLDFSLSTFSVFLHFLHENLWPILVIHHIDVWGRYYVTYSQGL